MSWVFMLPMVLQFKLCNLHFVTLGVGFWSSYVLCLSLCLILTLDWLGSTGTFEVQSWGRLVLTLWWGWSQSG